MADEQFSDSVSHWRVEPREGKDGLPDIRFVVVKPNCPFEQTALKSEVERTLSALRSIYNGTQHRAKFEESVERLISLAQVGLVGSKASTKTASDALITFQEDVCGSEARRIKNGYLKTLAIWSSVYGLAVFAFYLFSRLVFPEGSEIDAPININIVLIGSCVGIWLSFAIRKPVLSFYDLHVMEEDQLDPPIRVGFVLLLTLIAGIVVSKGLVDISVGNFRASSFNASETSAFLIGAFFGLGEKILPSTVMDRAKSFLAMHAKG